ncbi:MAG: chemoreceptor glutamine deamidase CheD [Porticoccaceae bacterium]|nr:chemoreceptor glutamine deamidase CheD [Porticoccaceae bacterium]
MSTAEGVLPKVDMLPEALSGFGHIQRYRDQVTREATVRIKPGEYYVSMFGETLTTVLGSCVSACIRDTRLGIGGMNHFMLPDNTNARSSAWLNTPVSDETRYGNVAMERLINTILANGGSRESLEVKLFGGGRVLDLSVDIGRKNLQFVRRYLIAESFSIQAEDVGGYRPRKIQYFPRTGRVMVKTLYKDNSVGIVGRETRYLARIKREKPAGKVDLFTD